MPTLMDLGPQDYQICPYIATEELGLKEDKRIQLRRFCQVVLATDVNDPVKKKVLKRYYLNEDNHKYHMQRFFFCNEVLFLRNLQHPNIIQVEKALVCPGEFAIMTEYHPTDLFGALRRLTDAEVAKYFIQVVDALNYLHNLHIVHGAVTLDNVLIDTQGNAKLCDFSEAQFVPNKSVRYWDGFPHYNGPEYIEGQPVEDVFKLENFSLGVFLCALSLRLYPDRGMDYLELLRGAESVPDIHRVCAERLLCPSPTERASISEIHQLLKDHKQPESCAQCDVSPGSPAPVSVPKRRKYSQIREEYRNLHSRRKALKRKAKNV